MKNVFVSHQFKLKLRDLLKAVYMGIGTPILYFALELIPQLELNPVAAISISALITYLIKNFVSPAAVVTEYETNEQAVKVAKEIEETKVG